MSGSLRAAIEVVLTARPLERVASEIAVAGFFTDERPLRGGAARADWRLCGGLSQRIESGDLSGKSGEALLIGCGQALRSPRFLLLGLGDRRAYDPNRVRAETCDALARCRALGLRRVALAPLGVAPDDVPRHVAALTAGIREAWGDGDDPGDDPRVLELCIRKREAAGIDRAFESACEAIDASDFFVSRDETTR